jgi:hypothetical protein
MTSGAMSNSNKSRNWRERKVHDGYLRVTIWLEPDYAARLSQYAFKEMVPKGVAAEKLIKKCLEAK